MTKPKEYTYIVFYNYREAYNKPYQLGRIEIHREAPIGSSSNLTDIEQDIMRRMLITPYIVMITNIIKLPY